MLSLAEMANPMGPEQRLNGKEGLKKKRALYPKSGMWEDGTVSTAGIPSSQTWFPFLGSW